MCNCSHIKFRIELLIARPDQRKQNPDPQIEVSIFPSRKDIFQTHQDQFHASQCPKTVFEDSLTRPHEVLIFMVKNFLTLKSRELPASSAVTQIGKAFSVPNPRCGISRFAATSTLCSPTSTLPTQLFHNAVAQLCKVGFGMSPCIKPTNGNVL